MSYEVVFASTAIRDLERIPPRIVPAVIEFAYGDLARNPQRVGKALERELAGLYSARRGPYRILYEIHDEEVRVIVIRVDHRADAYRPR
ncbi:type II toxin-antitoxin system RelE family toxin [Leifsonia aquatica]|uniref:type II toxin-antitoxin system RelE family toxin n=1 Tax=Leifsonia aquatica TaxID=144185 RepID=UPI0038258C20